MRFSNSTGNFYPEEIDYPELPDDLITVPDDVFRAAIDARNNGGNISVEEGKLVITLGRTKTSDEVLADAKINAMAKVTEFARQKRKKIAGTTDEIEISAWNNKLRIAVSILAGDASPEDRTAFAVEIETRALGETMEVFCAKVVRNAGFFSHSVGLIDGLKRRTFDLISAAVTPVEVDSVVASAKTLADSAFDQLMAARSA